MKKIAYAIMKKDHKTPSIYLFTSMSLCNHTYNTNLLKTKIYNFIHYKPSKKSPHIILSCLHISLSGKVVGNSLTVSQNIETFGPTPPAPKRWADT